MRVEGMCDQVGPIAGFNPLSSPITVTILLAYCMSGHVCMHGHVCMYGHVCMHGYVYTQTYFQTTDYNLRFQSQSFILIHK